MIILGLLIETKLNCLKGSFEEVYGEGLNPTNYTELEYYGSTRLTPNSNNVYVYDCFFHDISCSSEGGAVCCSSSVYKLLIEQSSFVSCQTSANNGGGIYFTNSHAAQCVLSKVCAFRCSCSTMGQFGYIQFNDNAYCISHFNDSTISRSLKKNSGQGDSLYLSSSIILFPSSNFSNNEIKNCPAFCCDTYHNSSENCIISFCSVINNTANEGRGCIRMYHTSCMHLIDTCNIINNQEPSYDSGTFQVSVYLLIKNSCILADNEEKIVFYFLYSPSRVTVSNCTIDSDKYRGAGTITFTETVESPFINSLSHIVTRSCDYYIDLYEIPTMTTHATSFQTETENHFQSETETENHFQSETETENHFPSSAPTWDGEWAEYPEVMVIDGDIPIIKATHYPLPTEYIKTQVPSVTTAANISFGIIVIIFIVVISLYNFIHSAKMLTSIDPLDKSIEANSEEYIFSNSEYST